jgi:Spy/CpxP family protein refolding chaperone
MKTLFLASVATLSVLSVATTRTSATKAKLPDAMLGDWCGQWGWQFPDDRAGHWWRT